MFKIDEPVFAKGFMDKRNILGTCAALKEA